MFAATSAFPQRCRRRVQIEHRSVLRESLAIVGPQHDPAARGEYRVGAVDQFGQHSGFALAESGLSLELENHRDRHPKPVLELRIGIDERLVQAPGKQAP